VGNSQFSVGGQPVFHGEATRNFACKLTFKPFKLLLRWLSISVISVLYNFFPSTVLFYLNSGPGWEINSSPFPSIAHVMDMHKVCFIMDQQLNIGIYLIQN
jgi:hypothetical protein